MSARNVCKGTRPSRYHSERAISAPFSRPDTLTLMPSAPSRIVFVTARRIARRNCTRRSSCCAIPSATSCASSSGFLISEMFSRTSCSGIPKSRDTSLRSASMSSPFLPITMPGRAVWIVMLAFFAGRSIWMRLTEACDSFFFRKARTFRSLAKRPAKSREFANHLEVQSFAMPRRMPVGCTFCPMCSLLLVRDRHGDVAGPLENAVTAPLRAGTHTLVGRALVHGDRRDLKLVDIRALVVLRVGDGRLQHLLHDGGGL